MKLFIYGLSTAAYTPPREANVRGLPTVNEEYLSSEQLCDRIEDLQRGVIECDVLILGVNNPTSAYLAGFAAARGVPVILAAHHATSRVYNPIFDSKAVQVVDEPSAINPLLTRLLTLCGKPACCKMRTVTPPMGDTNDDRSCEVPPERYRTETGNGEAGNPESEAVEPPAPSGDVGGEGG